MANDNAETANEARSNASSRALQPAASERSFHLLAHGKWNVDREVNDAVDELIPNVSTAIDQVGVIRATLRAAARGELPTGLDDHDLLEPVRRQPELWELKWKVRRKKKQHGELRMYHAEPRDGNPDLVGLKFHIKDLRGGSQAIESAQNAEMDTAADRYTDTAARRSRWGHRDGSHRGFCVTDRADEV